METTTLIQERKVLDAPNWVVVEPLTHKEAVALGRVQWCTARIDNESYDYTYNRKLGILAIFYRVDKSRPQYQAFFSCNGIELRDGGNKYVDRQAFLTEHPYFAPYFEKRIQEVPVIKHRPRGVMRRPTRWDDTVTLFNRDPHDERYQHPALDLRSDQDVLHETINSWLTQVMDSAYRNVPRLAILERLLQNNAVHVHTNRELPHDVRYGTLVYISLDHAFAIRLPSGWAGIHVAPDHAYDVYLTDREGHEYRWQIRPH